MSGLGVQYPPPTEDVPIFDPLLFLEAVAISSGGGGGGSYLNFPFAQGKETMADMDVTGLGQFFSGITMIGAINEDFTNNQNIIMNGVTGTNYIEFPDNSKQYTAGVPLTATGVVAGAYSNTNLTVNTYGQITTASNGTAGIPATPTITAGTTNMTQDGSMTYNQYGQLTAVTSGVIPSFAGGSFTNANVTVNTYGQVTAVANGTAGIPLTPTITAGTTNMTQDGSLTYNQYGQLTAITSGVIPSFAGGSFTNPNLTVNTYGQVTAITNGTGGLVQPPTYIASSLSSSVSGTFPLPPAGTKTMKIVQLSAGGLASYAYDSSTVSVGAGGYSGSYASFLFDVVGWSGLTEPMLGYNNQGAPSNSPVVFWTPYAGSIYPNGIANPPLSPPLGNGYFGNGQVSLPTYRTNTTSTANAPYNMYQADLMTCFNPTTAYEGGTVGIPSNNNYGTFVTSQGAGSRGGGTQPTSSVNISIPQSQNPNAVNAFDASIIAPWAQGVGLNIVADPLNPSVPIITVLPRGEGGWAIYFYS